MLYIKYIALVFILSTCLNDLLKNKTIPQTRYLTNGFLNSALNEQYGNFTFNYQPFLCCLIFSFHPSTYYCTYHKQSGLFWSQIIFFIYFPPFLFLLRTGSNLFWTEFISTSTPYGTGQSPHSVYIPCKHLVSIKRDAFVE